MSKIAINSFKFRFFPLFIGFNFVLIISDSDLAWFHSFSLVASKKEIIPSPKKEATGQLGQL